MDNLEGIYYLGLKLWLCYRGYDCNWDLKLWCVYVSELVYEKWWKVYDKMLKKLRGYCGLICKMEKNIEKWRKMVKVKGLFERYWRI